VLAGGYIIKPRGEVHAMWNAGSTARMIEVISPAGFEDFFPVTDMTAVGAPIRPTAALGGLRSALRPA
jgi:quercetin dioxygenase-like cupin family protein